MSKLYLTLTILIIAITGCSQPTQTANPYPQWVDQLIKQFESEPVGNPPQSIWKYEYDGQVVYYVPPQCCDQASTLYDANGKTICAPDGGFSGEGDSRCPDFLTNRTKEELVWRDTRSR